MENSDLLLQPLTAAEPPNILVASLWVAPAEVCFILLSAEVWENQKTGGPGALLQTAMVVIALLLHAAVL